MRRPYKRPGLTRRRALKTLGDPPLQALPDTAVLEKHLLSRAFRQGGIERGPVLRSSRKRWNKVERPMVSLGAQGHNEIEGAVTVILVERFEALGPKLREVGADLIHRRCRYWRNFVSWANASAVDTDQRAEMQAHQRRRHRRSDGVVRTCKQHRTRQ